MVEKDDVVTGYPLNDLTALGAASWEEKKIFLDFWAQHYNTTSFIQADPIALPHGFEKQQDKEIIGFWVAMLAWGQRKTIIAKGLELIELMNSNPFDFVRSHTELDFVRMQDFKHRTFMAEDTLYFFRTLQRLYRQYESMGDLFAELSQRHDGRMKDILTAWHEWFFDDPHAPTRTRKHVSTPIRGSACKRMNMFLRWMVRNDNSGVDLGLWKTVPTASLMIPLDVHVARVARRLNLLERTQDDWAAVEELTANLRSFDPNDPVKYDFALFGLGVNGLN